MADLHQDELRLVSSANKGEARAFEEMYRLHRDWVVSLARRWTGDHQDALDVLQETFVYLWSKFPGFRLTSSLRAYLYPIVRHTSVDVLRRRKRDEEVETALSDVCAEVDWDDGSDQAIRFRELLSQLTPGHREVVQLRFEYDFRLAEIAEALDIPIGTAKSRLHNALRALRTLR